MKLSQRVTTIEKILWTRMLTGVNGRDVGIGSPSAFSTDFSSEVRLSWPYCQHCSTDIDKNKEEEISMTRGSEKHSWMQLHKPERLQHGWWSPYAAAFSNTSKVEHISATLL